MLKKFATFFKLISSVRGRSLTDEILYLTYLTCESVKSVLSLPFPPGSFVFKDMFLKIKERENLVFYCPARTDITNHVMPHSEKKTWEVIKSVVRKGDIFIDVGAHVGAYTLPVAKIIGPRGKVIALEPSPFTFQILKRNVQLNRLNNVYLINKGAYSIRTHMNFYYDLRMTGHSSLDQKWFLKQGLPKRFCKTLKKEIEVAPLDEIIEELGLFNETIRLLKIDVEGSEVEVLKGATNILKNTDYIIFEASKRTLNSCLKLLPKYFKVSPIERIGRLTYNFIARRKEHS